MISESLVHHIGEGKRLLDESRDRWDVLVSAYNSSERVKAPFHRVNATIRWWMVHNEYQYSTSEYPAGNTVTSSATTESEFVLDVFRKISILPGSRLAVDITGFMRPHLLFLLKYLGHLGVRRFDALYTEPLHYERKAETLFSSNVYEVRQVAGYEGVHSSNMNDDVLVVGVGYDHDLVAQVIANKSRARLVQLLSLPSLSAGMYQESLLRLDRVADAPASVPDEQLCFASANDPFVTSFVLEEAIARLKGLGDVSNLYLSPLATKPQVLGFGLFYLKSTTPIPTSIVFPFARSYSKETATGVGRTWVYPISLYSSVL